METAPTSYVRYTDQVETRSPDEDRLADDVTASMRHISEIMVDRYRHAVRSVHSKSHGLLRGELTVHGDLPEPLRQGLFAEPASYPVIIRFSTSPGDILADSISTQRGMAVKVVGIEGHEMVPGHQGEVTQDFLFLGASKVFGSPGLKGFLDTVRLTEKHADADDATKEVVSNTARVANVAAQAVGVQSPALDFFGHPKSHILGETYCSLAALRYGDYFGKLCFEPASQNLRDLADSTVDTSRFSALRDAVVAFFKTETAVWDVTVQLCTDPAAMPVEDASAAWPEDRSPYRPVARITVPPQDAYSPERRVYVDDVLAFTPWHALAAHRPLGEVMRGRKRAYEMSQVFRHKMNAQPRSEPRSIDELPA